MTSPGFFRNWPTRGWLNLAEMADQTHTSLVYRPAIDGLRAIAVLSVCIFHLNNRWLPGGFVGVDIFFVISGYLITSIILKDCQNGSFSLRVFYQRRIARIYPAFFIVALVTLIGAYFIYTPQDLASAGANFASAALTVANMKFMLQGNYFTLSPDAQPYLHYWSLSVEEQFYMIFPLLFLVVFKYFRKQQVWVFGGLCVGSFLLCLLVTRLKPDWAFYLLPTRAWELLAGCILSILASVSVRAFNSRWRNWISILGLVSIAVSFLVIHEGPHFPGYLAFLPVVGAVCVLLPPVGFMGLGEKCLTFAPFVFIGRMSYSLYLWHWPIFSLIDYQLFLASEYTRLTLKIILSLSAATLSFLIFESPLRLFLNSRKNMTLAYVSMFCIVAICVLLGIKIRKEYYINAEVKDVAKGGLVYNSKSNKGSVILMGDSNGSMYGKVIKDICEDRGVKLIVISVDGGDPLPSTIVKQNQLWLDSLGLVQREKPDCLILACSWASKLQDHKEKMPLAVNALRPYIRRLVILNQPPILPEQACRISVRQGIRPPFYENPIIHNNRVGINEYLKGFNSENIKVVDIASHFQAANGEIISLDNNGRLLYHDQYHLSGFGAELIREDLSMAIF